MNQKCYEDGVSPVIGVLLMLVVTIIIAAIVSGFAGGLGSADKVPKATISAEYHQQGFMSFTHNGGDALATRDTKLVVRLTNEFGDVDFQSWEVNKSIITNDPTTGKLGSASAWVKTGGVTGIKSFQPGETNYIPNDGLKYIQNTGGVSATSTYALNNTVNIGKSIWVELYDKNGKMITKTQAKITS
jgi:archaeal type IV pilus assembly protein PilA